MHCTPGTSSTHTVSDRCLLQEAGDAGTMQDLINRQAEWSEEVNDYAAAADMYLKVRQSCLDSFLSMLYKGAVWEWLLS